MNEQPINFGIRVEQLMKEHGTKPFAFYRSIGIVAQNFYDWKRKDTIPNAVTALKVAKFFGVTVEFLLTGKDDNPLQSKVEELQARLQEIRQFIDDKTLIP